MTSIYFDNFRGFEKTFVQLQNVNFFIGENSTGKTSVLKLIKILSAPNFKLKYDLGDEFAEIGTHYDIVYKGGSNNYFEIGYETELSFIKIIFKPRDNKPVIYKLYAMIEKTSIEFTFEDKTVDFKFVVEECEKHSDVDFVDWISQSNDKFSGDNVESGSSHYFEALPLSVTVFGFLEKIFKFKSKNEGIQGSSLGELYMNVFKAFDSTQLPPLIWIDPIRAEPRRLYDEYSSLYAPTGSHAPYLLKKILTSKATRNNFKIKEFLKYGSASGLFTEIVPKPFDKNDDASPFELLIMFEKKAIKLNHVGYGVSQVLPLIVEIMDRAKGSWIAIQQPEVHLHPKAQAAFGDFIFAFAEKDEKNFVVETHSDFLIDRFRLAINKSNSPRKKVKVQAQVCFFERTPSGNVITYIPIHKDGSYGDEQPDSFRDFFLKEQLDLLSM